MQIKLTNDFVFKYVFGRESSKPILLDLINSVLTDSDFPPITDLTLKNPISFKSADFLKNSVLDIKAQDSSGNQFDIEVQVVQENFFVNRSLYYWSQMYSSQLDKGDSYKELSPVICINLTDFTVFPELKRFHNCFMLQEIHEKDYILTEDLSLHFIELTKIENAQGMLADWSKLIRESGEKEEEMNILVKKNPMLRKAHDAYLECMEDREARELALSREKFLRDQISLEKDAREARQEGLAEGLAEGLVEGERIGVAKGEQKGERKKALATARKLQDIGMSAQQISQITGLSLDDIEKL